MAASLLLPRGGGWTLTIYCGPLLSPEVLLGWFQWWLPKSYVVSWNVTLFVKTVFANVIKWKFSRGDHPGFRVGPKSIDKWSLWEIHREKEENATRGQRQRLEPQTKECPELPEAGRGKAGFSPWAFGDTLLLPWFQTSSLQNCERIYLFCFNPPSLWQFATAAWGD